MARKTIFNEYSEAISIGAVPVSNNKFLNADGTPMRIRSMELFDNYLEKGAEITIPKDYRVFSINENNINTLFIFVEIKYSDGTKYHRKFVPNSLAKIVFPLDEMGHRLSKIKTLGSVATWYAEQETVENAMMYLAGKTICVCNREVYSVRNRFTSEICNTCIYTYEWKKDNVDPKKSNPIVAADSEEKNIAAVSSKKNITRRFPIGDTSISKCIDSSSHSSFTNDIYRNEITSQFKHFSLHSMPFQESIVDVKCSNEIDYSNRIEWLSNLYLITESGYYIQCKEICKTINFNSKFDKYDDQPYEVFLDGILRMSWVYAYNAEYSQTLSLIKRNLGNGKLTVTCDDRNIYHFWFSAYGYSWI